ncbi:MAG: hypothetical protein GY863_22210, partial [bacterium]|nr:hypothetical protein [bacterium]
LHDIIRELADTYDPSNGYDNPSKLRKLLCDLEDHFTKGGTVYETDPIYQQEDDEVYSNAELSEVIREIFPYLQQIVVRSDRPNSLISDLYNDEVYPLKTMVKYLKKMGWNPDDVSLEQSFYNLMRHDIFGRDRVNDPEAYHISYLEHLLFFCSVASNVGYQDGGLTGEIKNITHPNFSHGHGDNWGIMTINDSMYAISTKKTFGLLGMYDLSFKDKDKNHLFRSRHPFTIENKDDHQFYVDQNYSIGRFTAGTTGDLGSPRNGGFNPKDENGEPIKNAYRPFCANGLEEDDVAVNTIVSSMHMTMNDQGPYYYAPPNPETIVLADGKTYSIYYMLTGEADIGSSDPNDPCHEAVEEVYAYVHKPADGSDNWEYVYAEDPCDNDPEYGDHVFLVGKLKEKKTHALFLSQEDLSDGVDIGILRTLRIQMGDPENPDVNVVVSFPFGTYYQQDVVRVINSAVGETVCYPYDVGEKRYIQVKSSYGPITL